MYFKHPERPPWNLQKELIKRQSIAPGLGHPCHSHSPFRTFWTLCYTRAGGVGRWGLGWGTVRVSAHRPSAHCYICLALWGRDAARHQAATGPGSRFVSWWLSRMEQLQGSVPSIAGWFPSESLLLCHAQPLLAAASPQGQAQQHLSYLRPMERDLALERPGGQTQGSRPPPSH